MKDKKRVLILLKILDKIHKNNKDVRKKTEKPITATCTQEGISFEQVFYILFFDSLAYRLENLLNNF